MVARHVLHCLFALLVLCSSVSAQDGPARPTNPSVFQPDCWGVYSWCSWNTRKVTRRSCPLIKGAPIVMHSNKIEPEPGEFAFDDQLGDKLALVKGKRLLYFPMIWVAPNAPRWLYENGVPELKMTPTISPRRQPRNWTFQYYLDEDYIGYYYRLIRHRLRSSMHNRNVRFSLTAC
ncbi:MAG: hypothetical protein ISS70_12770 [Phycisphaerae bacterium]|nr:hypothetical protein [Phycisphaerae bacterium]